MTFLVELTNRADRDLRRIYQRINAENSRQARDWFNEPEAAVLSLDRNPARGAVTPEDRALRELRFGRKRNVYRIIYSIDERRHTVAMLHIRRAAQDAFTPEDHSSE